MAALEEVVTNRNDKITLVIGNGINLFQQPDGNDSWKNMLRQICDDNNFTEGKQFLDALSLVEFSDLLQMHISAAGTKDSVQKQFCEKLVNLRFGDHHTKISTWAANKSIPILTTNFDTTLSDSCDASLMRHKTPDTPNFTDYYPWSKYYSTQPIEKPHNSFGIWHVNGMREHTRSVRLALSHYMGSVHRARSWMHRGGNERLFDSENSLDRWKGKDTWLDAFFRNDLLIFGLGLAAQEVFLRWLLIERKRLYLKFENLKRKAWYVCTTDEKASDREFFLDMLGVKTVVLASHDDIYGSPAWQS